MWLRKWVRALGMLILYQMENSSEVGIALEALIPLSAEDL